MVKKSGSEKWCFLHPKWCSILLAWSLSWQNWPLKFKRISRRRQWPRRWFLWAVCRTISSALSWIPSLMIFEIRFLFVVCPENALLFDFASILRLLVAVGSNGHWWCSDATSDQCNGYHPASVCCKSNGKVFIHTCSMVLFPHCVLLAGSYTIPFLQLKTNVGSKLVGLFT